MCDDCKRKIEAEKKCRNFFVRNCACVPWSTSLSALGALTVSEIFPLNKSKQKNYEHAEEMSLKKFRLARCARNIKEHSRMQHKFYMRRKCTKTTCCGKKSGNQRMRAQGRK